MGQLQHPRNPQSVMPDDTQDRTDDQVGQLQRPRTVRSWFSQELQESIHALSSATIVPIPSISYLRFTRLSGQYFTVLDGFLSIGQWALAIGCSLDKYSLYSLIESLNDFLELKKQWRIQLDHLVEKVGGVEGGPLKSFIAPSGTDHDATSMGVGVALMAQRGIDTPEVNRWDLPTQVD
jgi:hypothetical protein